MGRVGSDVSVRYRPRPCRLVPLTVCRKVLRYLYDLSVSLVHRGVVKRSKGIYIDAKIIISFLGHEKFHDKGGCL